MADKKAPTKLSRREFFVLSSQGIALTVLASCAQPGGAPQAPAAEGEAPAKAPATVEFLAWGDPADIPAWEKLASMYMGAVPYQCG